MSAGQSLSVCVVTYMRPDFLFRCLQALTDQISPLTQVVIVDASPQSVQGDVEAIRATATYVHAPSLAGWMTRSRNEALQWTDGQIIAFLDDDVVVRPDWERGLLHAFADPSVEAVAGRTCNGIPGEEYYSPPVGRLLSDGRLTEGFASLPDTQVRVDHGIGANMAFRRRILARLGGFRDDYPGTAMREDTDIFLRVRALGARTVFEPDAAVDHLPAPHVRGARFDTRYKLYARRNHVVLLARDGGIGSPALRRWIRGQFANVGEAAGLGAKLRRLGVTGLGIAWGVVVLPRYATWGPSSPERRDRTGSAIRARLER